MKFKLYVWLIFVNLFSSLPVQLEDEEIDSEGSDIEPRDDVGYESEEDRETVEEKKLRLARLFLQVHYLLPID